MIIYNSVDITNSVQPVALTVTDNAGGKPDRISAAFADPDGMWNRWKPAKGDTIQVKEGGFDSGVMYIDQLTQTAGSFGLAALSITQESKSARSQSWEDVRLMEIVTEIAARHGFTVQIYGIDNHHYDRVDQLEEPDFAFLARRSLIEGYALKISNRSLVIYDELTEEQKTADPKLATIRVNQMNGGFRFESKSTDIFRKCIVRSQYGGGYLEGVFEDTGINGPTVKHNLHSTNIAEADRWARGILRSYNKHQVTGFFTINLNTNFAAGTVVDIHNTGMFDGKYFIDQLTHDLTNNRTRMTVRKPLNGY